MGTFIVIIPRSSLIQSGSIYEGTNIWLAQLAGAVEYTDCFSAER